jgi:nucleotide-binding universal stress UspA family protein
MEPVVVAVGADGGGHAVEWAAAEAAARGCTLHVVHVIHPRWVVDPSGLVPLHDVSDCAMAGGQVVQAAVTRAASVAPALEISAEVRSGPTVASLLRSGSGAGLLVLGGRPPPSGDLPAMLDRSVGGRVAGRARCPVVVVKRLPDRPCSGPPPRVVVGVGGTASSAAAVDFAFRAAAQRGLSMTAIHAWTPDTPADLEGVSGPVGESEARARAVLDEAVARGASRAVDVPIEPRLVYGDPVATLVRESEGAALVVVGSRGRGTVRATVFGSVSRSVARRVCCPAVVVRGDAAGPGAGAGRRTAVPREQPGRRQPERRQTPWA